MTSLIDVIFLLLLFFMLTSTFSKFSEVELPTGGSNVAEAADRRILFLRPAKHAFLLNGQMIAASQLPETLKQNAAEKPSALLVSLTDQTTAQELVDILGVARKIADLPVSVLEAS